jgi:hypothetical protein
MALGVKDVIFDFMFPSEFDEQVSMLDAATPLVPVDPSYARKLLRDAAAYASSLGLRPHRWFAASEQLFGDVRAEDCAEEFSFGIDGRPVYIPGPVESAAQIERRLSRLTERLGSDGFDIVIPLADELVDQLRPALPRRKRDGRPRPGRSHRSRRRQSDRARAELALGCRPQ